MRFSSLIYSCIRSVDHIIWIFDFGFSGRKLELESAALTLLSLISGASLTVREVALHKRSSPTTVVPAEGVSKKCERSVIRCVNSLIKGGHQSRYRQVAPYTVGDLQAVLDDNRCKSPSLNNQAVNGLKLTSTGI